MNSIYYKVIFRGSKLDEEVESNELSLTFKSFPSRESLSIPPELILELKKLAEKSHNIISLQNIDEVIQIGPGYSQHIFNYYYIILFTIKENAKKLGYLIGNKKKVGDVLIGMWPFNKQIITIAPEEVHQEFVNLIKKPHEYSNITLITG